MLDDQHNNGREERTSCGGCAGGGKRAWKRKRVVRVDSFRLVSVNSCAVRMLRHFSAPRSKRTLNFFYLPSPQAFVNPLTKQLNRRWCLQRQRDNCPIYRAYLAYKETAGLAYKCLVLHRPAARRLCPSNRPAARLPQLTCWYWQPPHRPNNEHSGSTLSGDASTTDTCSCKPKRDHRYSRKKRATAVCHTRAWEHVQHVRCGACM